MASACALVPDALASLGGGPSDFLRLGLTPARASCCTRGLRGRFRAVRLACLLPHLASGVSLLSRPLGLALGLFHPLTGALELLFRDPNPLPGDLCLQPCTLQRLSRISRRARRWRGSIRAFACRGPRRTGRPLFFCCLPHAKAGGGKGRPVSHNGPGLATVILSTDFVNNPVQSGAWRRQSRCGGKGLRQRGQRLISRRTGGTRSRRVARLPGRGLSACARAAWWR